MWYARNFKFVLRKPRISLRSLLAPRDDALQLCLPTEPSRNLYRKASSILLLFCAAGCCRWILKTKEQTQFSSPASYCALAAWITNWKTKLKEGRKNRQTQHLQWRISFGILLAVIATDWFIGLFDEDEIFAGLLVVILSTHVNKILSR